MNTQINQFGDVLPQANLLAWYGKTNLTQQKHAFTDQNKCTTTQNRHKLECGPMFNVMAVQPNTGDALCHIP